MAFVLPQQNPPQTSNHAQAQQQEEERALHLPWYRAAYLLCHYCDRELKRATVLDAIQYICTESNDNQQDSVLQDIHKALEEGDDKLEAVILSSGNGSYSFIVFVDNRPELCLYAELTFGENMEQRAENEWANMLRRYSTPLGCWDVVEEDGTVMKLLCAEWSNKKTQRSESKKTS